MPKSRHKQRDFLILCHLQLIRKTVSQVCNLLLVGSDFGRYNALCLA